MFSRLRAIWKVVIALIKTFLVPESWLLYEAKN